ncbi:hypothetical protein ABK040_002565 [Willaertia magna]
MSHLLKFAASIIALLLLINCSSSFRNNKDDPLDRQLKVLREFYNSTRGYHWKNSSGWNDSNNTDPCTWYGVRCRNGGLFVSTLRLSKNGLVGIIPESIGELTYLEHLFLDANQIVGNIPNSIGKLKYLISLYLDLNQLSGELPLSMVNLTSLQYLTVEMNHLSGEIPNGLSKLPLSIFNVAFNEFTGTFPGGLCDRISCDASRNKGLKCPSNGCDRFCPNGCCNLETCNCNYACFTDQDCAGGLCGKCRLTSQGPIKLCRK